MRKADAEQLRHEAYKNGMKPLAYDGIAKVKASITSLEEIYPLVSDAF
jgi:type II secretory ATPase GspE/PulE/Tfp pilus assembly ATPase PilB-like protein